MSRKKLRQGPMITSLDHLARCEWVIIHGKPYNRGWVMSWNVRTAKGYVDRGRVFEGIRLTNGQYYAHLTNEQIRERFGEEIHEACSHSPSIPGMSMISGCDGLYCWKALQEWKEEPVK